MRYISYFLMVLIIFTFAFTVSAGYREVFEKEFLSKPWGVEKQGESACIVCHTSDIMKTEFQKIPHEWQISWHYQNDISCHDCHGGDPEDETMSMSHQRGFGGSPEYADVPEFCGKCHIGILKNYIKSGHGKALKSEGTGPNCITCHGSHNIQKASIDIINAQQCSKCHSYARAKIMKQAIFLTEKKIQGIENNLVKLKDEGVFPEEEEKALFRTHAEFRTLFHTIDVNRVAERTDEFTKRLTVIETKIDDTFKELDFRKNFSAFLMLIFIGIAITLSMLSRTYKE